MDYQTIKYEKVDHIATNTLNRPERHNADNSVINDELNVAWKDFRDDDVLVAIITGAGDKAFRAGFDLEDAAADNFEFTDYEKYRQDIYNCEAYCGYPKRADIFKPIIVAVNGYAVAAGMERAMLADIQICAENAQFGATGRR